MEENVFMTGGKALTLEDYLQYDAGSRGNLGEELPVMVYRLLEYSLKEELSELQSKMQELKIGVLRIEKVDEESGKIILNVSEDADCSGLPILGETVCNYDEGFIGGILSMYSGKFYTAVEVDCWATGDRVCRFHANIEDEK